jgi:alanine racemase
VITQIPDIARVIGSRTDARHDLSISHLLTDSRQLLEPASTLFFAIAAHRRDGHDFIRDLHGKGVKNFVITRSGSEYSDLEDSNFLEVTDSLAAMQELAAWHRSKFHIPVIGITGSNGKTIVKEWLYQLLHEDFNIVRSPKSYNSQVGVPLSVWQMREGHDLAIFEAGISKPGEMDSLEKIIRPTIGVLTSLGEAHSEGFNSPEQKMDEKMKLFHGAGALVYGMESGLPGSDLAELHSCLNPGSSASYYAWSVEPGAWLTVKDIRKTASSATIDAFHSDHPCSITIPFTDEASVKNALTCWTVLLVLGVSQEKISAGMSRLQPVNMRLELKKGRNGCTIINDSYSADLSSLSIALDFMEQQHNDLRKTVILSDFLQSSMPDQALYSEVIGQLDKHGVSRFIGIGPRISKAFRDNPGPGERMEVRLFETADAMLQQFRTSLFRDEIILVKGARVFEFEKIVQVLEQKSHQTILEIDLNSIAHNLKQYQARLEKGTKVMAMVKAFAYGSGGAEIAGILQYHKIDYLGVAYADEGVELRKAGISVPIMVMNPEQNSFYTLLEYRLEPELYSFQLLEQWENFLGQQAATEYPVHIEIETGMNRLGFDPQDVERLADVLKQGRSMVRSVFSHLAASEDMDQDKFTRQQYERFLDTAVSLERQLGYKILKHIANSAAIIRHPYAHLDMVRLGIGLYGIEQNSSELDLQVVATLKSTVAQIKSLEAGDSVSYNRRGIVGRQSLIATIRIGYADGIPRRLGNGKGKVWVRGKLAPVIGTVCMDMIMIDITDIPGIGEGDEVVIFGRGLPVQELASWADTIPYEIMTGISQRVKRVYFME